MPVVLLTPAPEPAMPGPAATDSDVAAYLVRAVTWGRGLRDQLQRVAALLAK